MVTSGQPFLKPNKMCSCKIDCRFKDWQIKHAEINNKERGQSARAAEHANSCINMANQSLLVYDVYGTAFLLPVRFERDELQSTNNVLELMPEKTPKLHSNIPECTVLSFHV